MELLTAAEMRALEFAAMDSGAATGLELMERAGAGVLSALLEWRASMAQPGRAAVLCGPGNNGGDGFVIARLLQERGWAVEVFHASFGAAAPADAAENERRWRALGGVAPLSAFAAAPGGRDLVVDALFGTGLSRPLEGDAAACARWSCARGAAEGVLVAVDLPSGVCSDSGRVLGEAAFRADLTVTFHRERAGHRLDEGPARAGALRVADIGLTGEAAGAARLHAPEPARIDKHSSHKYGHGHALILSGGAGAGGAARLAARGALRMGAGLVTLGAPPAAMFENAMRLDAIMLRRIADGAALSAALEDERLNAVVLGPGLGLGARARELAAAALASGSRGVVLDADALSVFADEPEALFSLTRGKSVVFTPHMGEFGQLSRYKGEARRAGAARPGFLQDRCGARSGGARGLRGAVERAGYGGGGAGRRGRGHLRAL